MKQIIIILCLLFLLQDKAGAQVSGVGRGKLAALTYSTPGAIVYTDDVRAELTSIAQNGVGVFEYRVTVASAAIANTFRAGSGCRADTRSDMVVIMQMKGGPVGRHQNGYVKSIFLNTLIICTEQPFIIPFVPIGSGGRVQMIRINEYSNLTLNSGQISCHPWDESNGTGGVLCFTVKNRLTINGGVINAAGKGFGPTGVSWGAGGTGAAGATTIIPGGPAAPTDAYVMCTNRYLLPGFDGGAANNTGINGALNNPATPTNYNPGVPVFKTKAVMGMAGYYPNSYQGGKGAGGGGKGGTGGTSCVGAGLAGANGIAGQKGGDPGKGALGGGIIIIKATNMDVSGMSANAKCLNASGQNGDSGRPGGDGGQGGKGGDGGDGICNTCDPAGPGGRGATGIPGNGGDGSNGGYPGTLWVAAGSITGTITANNVVVNGGQAGWGGAGGFGWIPWSQQVFADPCTDTPCFIPSGCTDMHISEVCSRDKAFCLLSVAATAGYHTAGATGVAGGGYEYRNAGVITAIYDSVSNILYGVEYDYAICEIRLYRANLYSPGDCGKIFKKLAFAVTNDSSATGQIVDLRNSDDGGTCLLPSAVIVFKDSLDDSMFVYDGNLGYIEDLSEPGHPRCYVGSCVSGTGLIVPGSLVQGGHGREGMTAPSGSKEVGVSTPADPTSNAVIQDLGGAPMWRIAADEEALYDDALKLYPQPADQQVKLLLPGYYSGNIDLKVYDLSGRLLKEQAEQLAAGRHELQINISALQTGVYILQVVHKDHEPVSLKMIVE